MSVDEGLAAGLKAGVGIACIVHGAQAIRARRHRCEAAPVCGGASRRREALLLAYALAPSMYCAPPLQLVLALAVRRRDGGRC
ncbi:hypothetical protein PQR75_15835 [Paraburkholderia fungorum]|uniref:hypothetical protein n=1 Tax=Paraburkholderia fungorum TaxID=134537 RepID=UPI0038BAE370